MNNEDLDFEDLDKKDVSSYNKNSYTDLYPDEVPSSAFDNKEIDPDSMRWMMDPTPELNEIEKSLCGYYHDPKEDVYRRIPKDDRLINDSGVHALMSNARALINKNISQGAIELSDVKYCTFQVMMGLLWHLCVFGNKKYGVDRNNYEMIINMFDIPIFMFLTRAIGGKERSRFGNNPLNNNIIPQKQTFLQKMMRLW